jgi:hypothetical protein
VKQVVIIEKTDEPPPGAGNAGVPGARNAAGAILPQHRHAGIHERAENLGHRLVAAVIDHDQLEIRKRLAANTLHRPAQGVRPVVCRDNHRKLDGDSLPHQRMRPSIARRPAPTRPRDKQL